VTHLAQDFPWCCQGSWFWPPIISGQTFMQ